MKSYTSSIVAAGALLLNVAGTQLCTAQNTNVFPFNTNLFAATFEGFCVSTNASGLTYERETTADLIRDCLADRGLTNLTDFSAFALAFNRSNNSIVVISNATRVCTNFTFGGGLALTNTNNTVVVLQQFVFVETNLVASGFLSAVERLTRGATGELTSFTLKGHLLYNEAASGTNGPAICRGILRVGDAIGEEQEGEEDHDGDNDNDQGEDHKGNNGHHGNGNNGNNGNGNNGNHGNGNNGNNGNHGNNGKNKNH